MSDAEVNRIEELEATVKKLRTTVTASTVGALLLGTGGAFGAFKYFIERPLVEEIQSLDVRVKHAELDKQERTAVIEKNEKLIAQISAQLELAQKRAAAVEDLESRLDAASKANEELGKRLELGAKERESLMRRKQAEIQRITAALEAAKDSDSRVVQLTNELNNARAVYRSELSRLQQELEQRRRSGSGWFGR